MIFTPGKNIALSDTLSRACPQGTNLFEDLDVDFLLFVCLVVVRSENTMAKYKQAILNDEELSVVGPYIDRGWPMNKKMCSRHAMFFGTIETVCL